MILLVLVAGLAFDGDVARLGNAAPEVRQRSRLVLLRAGEKAVPSLEKGLEHDDVEVRRESAALLDQLFERSLKGKRRYKAYVIPKNKMTENVRQWGKQLQPFILQTDAHFRAYSRHFRGELEKWRAPLLADYNGLLLTLQERLDAFAKGEAQALQHLCALDAVVWKLQALGAGTGKNHWTTRWVVRRRVLPALDAATFARRREMSQAEVRIYRSVLSLVAPLCRKAGTSLSKRIGERLPKNVR